MHDQSKITTLLRGLTEWADRGANERFLQRDQESVLQEAPHDPRLSAQEPVAAWMLGTWHLGHGFTRVLRGDGRGFDEARIGQALRRCSLLLRDRNQPTAQKSNAPFSLLQATLTVLMGLALEDPGAEPLYERMRTLPDRAFDGRDHLPRFARELLELRAGKRTSPTAVLGPYQEVLLHWSGDRQWHAKALAETLEVHLQQAGSGSAMFEDPPSRLYPLEVLATRKVRTWLELPNPKVDHALMFTNLVTMQPDPAWPSDPIVKRLELALARR